MLTTQKARSVMDMPAALGGRRQVAGHEFAGLLWLRICKMRYLALDAAGSDLLWCRRTTARTWAISAC
jgi:hypothetical protein